MILRYLGKFPFFYYEIKRDINKAKEFKKKARINNQHHGHITESKEINFYIFKIKVFNFEIFEGENLTTEHYYLNRSIKDIKKILFEAKSHLNIDSDSLIFDPGCGAGRHLIYLVDKYNCNGIGVDVYKPAIQVAKKLNLSKKCNFICSSSLDGNILNLLIKKKPDLILINSWLSFVKYNKDFELFIKTIRKINCKLIIISNIKEEVEILFKDFGILYKNVNNNTVYALMENKLKV